MPELVGFGGSLETVEVRYLAETPGFEPGVPHSGHDGLANRWFQPLTHVSALTGGKWLPIRLSPGL